MNQKGISIIEVILGIVLIVVLLSGAYILFNGGTSDANSSGTLPIAELFARQ